MKKINVLYDMLNLSLFKDKLLDFINEITINFEK